MLTSARSAGLRALRESRVNAAGENRAVQLFAPDRARAFAMNAARENRAVAEIFARNTSAHLRFIEIER